MTGDDRIPRRTALIRLTGVAGSLLAGGRLGAQGGTCLEGQTVRWLVGYSPGGGYDAYARLIEPFLERALRARIMIQNLPGAAGAVAVRSLADARPNGRTIGILDGPGALWSHAANEKGAPDPLRDLTILGRVARLQHTLVTGPRSGVRTMEELVALGRRRRIVFGATASGSQNFVSCAVLGRLFGLDADYIVGYPGSRELTLALLRGDFDAMSFAVESGLSVIGPDRIIPLLMVTPEPMPYAEFDGVPTLTGDYGRDHLRPSLFAVGPDEVRDLGAAIRDYLDFGRIVAAPAGVSDSLRRCLEDALLTALRDPGLAAAAVRAQRTLAIASASEVRSGAEHARAAVARILPIAADAARRAR